jgi:pyruvate dehydrogenase E1 component alpha subunit
VARTPKAAAPAVPLTSNPAGEASPLLANRERPPQPQRYQASKEELLDFYKQMLLIRRFEERAGQL